MNLPIINCDGCGACCLSMGSPPFLGFEIYELPIDLQKEVLDNIESEHNKVPCHWYDISTKKCRNYNYRPKICRDFEINNESCRSYRLYYGIDK